MFMFVVKVHATHVKKILQPLHKVAVLPTAGLLPSIELAGLKIFLAYMLLNNYVLHGGQQKLEEYREEDVSESMRRSGNS